jgi:hypothetical protein
MICRESVQIATATWDLTFWSEPRIASGSEMHTCSKKANRVRRHFTPKAAPPQSDSAQTSRAETLPLDSNAVPYSPAPASREDHSSS